MSAAHTALRAGRIYIAGPMTGYAELNFPAFHAEAKALRVAGLEVINPAEINVDPNMGWAACMRADIAQLVTCDRIHLLPGWSNSKGASLEHHIASALGLLVTLADGAESAEARDEEINGHLPDGGSRRASRVRRRPAASSG